MSDHRVRAATVVALVWAAVVGALASPAGAEETVAHQPPVDAPVVDPFRPPATRYGPGNRGLTYDLATGTAVRASGGGTVVFAGPVGGSLHVTVRHADGLRTSYSFLASVSVRRGQRVSAGAVVGTGGRGFHFGLRDGDTYLDPASLFGATSVRVRLVPHAEPLPPTDASLQREHAILRELVLTEEPGVLRRTWNAIARHAGPVAERIGQVGSVAVHLFQELPRAAVVADVVEALWAHHTQACTGGDIAAEVPPGPRVALLVAGLGSSSDHGAIDDVDVAALGYDPGDVLRFSYSGGRVPGGAALHPSLAAIDAAPYVAADTNADVVEQGRALADLVQEVAAARPGVPVDLYAHSLGGVVTRVALLELSQRPGGLDALGTVVTIGTPHQGADLATAAVAAGPRLHTGLDRVFQDAGVGIDADGSAVLQLAETSDLVDHLARAGVPEGVDFRTIAARGDMVATADKAHVADQPAAVVDLAGPAAHDALPGDPTVTRELRLALAGLPPQCEGLADAVLDAVMPETVSWVTSALTLGVLLSNL